MDQTIQQLYNQLAPLQKAKVQGTRMLLVLNPTLRGHDEDLILAMSIASVDTATDMLGYWSVLELQSKLMVDWQTCSLDSLAQRIGLFLALCPSPPTTESGRGMLQADQELSDLCIFDCALTWYPRWGFSPDDVVRVVRLLAGEFSSVVTAMDFIQFCAKQRIPHSSEPSHRIFKQYLERRRSGESHKQICTSLWVENQCQQWTRPHNVFRMIRTVGGTYGSGGIHESL